MTIKLDTTYLLANNIPANGLDPNSLTRPHDAYREVTSNLKGGSYGFAEIVKDFSVVDECKAVYDTISWAKQMVVVGIGGSDLGARMLQNALEVENPPMQVFFTGDTTDPYSYLKLTSSLQLTETVVVIVSKSGSTIETASGYLYYKKVFQDVIGIEWAKHFVFITDPKEGIMREEADKYGVLTLPVPDNVGGRYSVLSAVGILPALAMGIDCTSLIQGASEEFELLQNQSETENIAWQIAYSQYLFQKEKGTHTVVCMPYAERLDLFANWFRQLWAESLGKDGKGILPIKAVGPKDQHSQVQFYNQGVWLSTFLFIGVEKPNEDITLEVADIPQLNYLNGKSMHTILNVELQATRQSLAENNRPSALVMLETLNATHIGALIALFEISVVYLAKLIDVNPFDQPGVEKGKVIIKKLLE